MNISQDKYSLWIIPTYDDLNYLDHYISHIANETKTKIYTPHCTLIGGINGLPDKDKIEKIIHHFDSPIVIRAKSVNVSAIFWKSIYIQLVCSDNLCQLQSEIHRGLFPENPYIFDPHISLAYLNKHINNKAHLARKIGVKSTFEFNRIQLMKTGDDVDKWEKIFEVRIGETK
ncbi:MAG: hypothetical protein HQ509_08400 [Candidatus Marinimicrobia bacterium]|nr:hypothetical protein [Candidatus Neomarinimicrobiota bacterium]